MIPWLDFLLFGNGGGLAQPAFRGQFYWLLDAHTERGTFYIFSHGFGAQLTSIQWRTPLPGERRLIQGKEFRPFSTDRHGPRVLVRWGMTLPENIDEANAEILAFKEAIQK